MGEIEKWGKGSFNLELEIGIGGGALGLGPNNRLRI